MRKRKIDWWRVATVVTGAALAVTLLTGFYDGDQELVEDTYTVQEGDTLRAISYKYMEKNTGGNRYILEFEEGIRELNPELWQQSNIYPGEVLRINYWIKK